MQQCPPPPPNACAPGYAPSSQAGCRPRVWPPSRVEQHAPLSKLVSLCPQQYKIGPPPTCSPVQAPSSRAVSGAGFVWGPSPGVGPAGARDPEAGASAGARDDARAGVTLKKSGGRVFLRQTVRFKRELYVDGGNRNGPTEPPPTYGPMIALRSPRRGWTEHRKGQDFRYFSVEPLEALQAPPLPLPLPPTHPTQPAT